MERDSQGNGTRLHNEADHCSRGRLGEITGFERLARSVKASEIAFLRTTLAKGQKDTETVHYELAVACLDYLRGSFGNLAFLQYAATFWSTRLDKAGSQKDEKIKEQI